MSNVVVMVPGLGDEIRAMGVVAWWWKRYGIKTVVFGTRWKSKENYGDKLGRLVELVEKEVKSGSRVSLVGISAGGSLVINAYERMKKKVDRVITVCARLKRGKIFGWWGFEARIKGYPAFGESVLRAEEVASQLSKEDRHKIMTVRAWLGDELVPSETAVIGQAKNITVPMAEHTLSIAASLTIFSRPLIDFIRK